MMSVYLSISVSKSALYCIIVTYLNLYMDMGCINIHIYINICFFMSQETWDGSELWLTVKNQPIITKEHRFLNSKVTLWGERGVIWLIWFGLFFYLFVFEPWFWVLCDKKNNHLIVSFPWLPAPESPSPRTGAGVRCVLGPPLDW